MSRTLQFEAERLVDAKLRATAAAKPEPGRSLRGVACPQCGMTGDGYAIVEELLRAGWIETTVGERTRYFDGATCLQRYNADASRVGMLPAVRVVRPALDAPPVPASPGTTRTTSMRCSRSGCAAALNVQQSRLADGSWSPDAEKIRAFAGWQPGGYCGRSCAEAARGEARMVAMYEPTPVAVTTIADASYQARLAASRAPANQLAREVPDGVGRLPPKRGR